ncbi:unannotated protein [freshwater metagenome]|uniref:Unannotated protein n=1 Tax=freshwater metagenome TaxID=449393 RepID=A0A6J7SXL4_9ZZZZ
MVFDPGIANPDLVRAIEDALDRHHLTPVAIIATHGHLDHTFSIQPLAAKSGIPAYIHSADRELLAHPERALSPETTSLFGHLSFSEPDDVIELHDGMKVHLAGMELVFDHSPGHTEGSVCIREESAGLLFSGDVLFNNGIGRTDLPTGSPAKMRTSLLKVFELDDAYRVFPGHGPTTTIGDERLHNEYLAAAIEGRI